MRAQQTPDIPPDTPPARNRIPIRRLRRQLKFPRAPDPRPQPGPPCRHRCEYRAVPTRMVKSGWLSPRRVAFQHDPVEIAVWPMS